MADATTQPVAQPTPEDSAAAAAAPALGSYAMSRDGRRQAIVLLLGVISIWVFALWTLITTLDNGLDGAEWVTAILMIAILLVAPLVGWTLLEEANARYAVAPEGLTYSTFGGINLTFPWSDITGVQPKDAPGRLARFFLGDDAPALAREPEPAEPNAPEEPEPEGEPRTVLLGLSTSPSSQIANPLVRFLHKQAHGDALPIYGGLENQQTLLDEIASRIQPT